MSSYAGRPGQVDLVADEVGVQDDRALLRENLGDNRFAGADAACKADRVHVNPGTSEYAELSGPREQELSIRNRLPACLVDCLREVIRLRLIPCDM